MVNCWHVVWMDNDVDTRRPAREKNTIVLPRRHRIPDNLLLFDTAHYCASHEVRSNEAAPAGDEDVIDLESLGHGNPRGNEPGDATPEAVHPLR